MTELPTGIVTFLFTDIEGSTELWEKHPQAMKATLAKHDSILRAVVEANHGQIIKTTGDGVHVVFSTTLDAINATLAVQQRLKEPIDELNIKVRMGLHTGEAELRDGDYYGQSLNRAARIMSIGHGGQILISETAMQVVREHLSQELTLLELGEHYLKGLARPEKIYQLVAADLDRKSTRLNSSH